jgi:hypothetical protein
MSNARDLIKRNNGQFLKGSKGLGGRKLGSKNKLATQYSDDLYRKWKQYGPGCLDTLGKAAIDGDTQAAKAFVTAGTYPKTLQQRYSRQALNCRGIKQSTLQWPMTSP